ncbi:MAG TPA: hypothetical protein VHP32_10585 [Ignavibacteria bacterium]|nr:hypothetical protein [Ignavibacteria bacterium]
MKSKKKAKTIKLNFNDIIPSKLRFSHDYCLFLLKHILHVQDSLIANKIYHTKILKKDLKEEDREEFDKVLKNKNFDWLIEKGYTKIHFEIIYKALIQRLIDDLIIFIREALFNSIKGDLVITFTLLRKPLKENLLILEWLLVNPKECHKLFYSDVSKISPLKTKDEKKKFLIKEALQKIDNLLLNDELIFNIRYNKDAYYTFHVLWNHSIHLITTFEGTKTQNTNINYIFSTNKDIQNQWKGLYFLLPYLLYYISEIQNGLFGLKEILKENDYFAKEEGKKVLGFIVWGIENKFWDKKIVNLNVLSQKDKIKDIECPKCSYIFSLDVKKIKQLVIDDFIRCNRCKTKFELK